MVDLGPAALLRRLLLDMSRRRACHRLCDPVLRPFSAEWHRARWRSLRRRKTGNIHAVTPCHLGQFIVGEMRKRTGRLGRLG
jgi:hypothetical protein